MINAIVAIGQTPWEAQFVSGLTHPMTGLKVQRRCVDALDVLAVTKVLSCDVVIISDHTLRVSQEFVAAINNQKIRLIALTQNTESFKKLGKVECVLIDANNPLAAISTLAALVRVNKATPPIDVQPTGELIFVGGFGGGTGKSRLAMEVAYQLSTNKKRTLLVDADTYGPSLLQLFGLPISTPGFLEICRKVERKSNEQGLIHESSIQLADNLNLIPGLVKSSRWIDLRQPALKDFWELCLSEFDYVVVDSGPVLEAEQLLTIETGLPKRNLVSVSALSQAKKVLLTARRDPISITRLIKGISECQNQFKNKSVFVACLGPGNKKNEKEVTSALQLHTDLSSIHIFDFDFESVAKAEAGLSLVSKLFPTAQLALMYQKTAQAIVEQVTNSTVSSRLRKLVPKKNKAEVA